MSLSLDSLRARIQGMLYRAMLSSLGKPATRMLPTSPVSPGRNTGCPSDFDHLIAEVCQRQGVDPALVKAVIKVESNFDCRAVSRAGAKGLMQLMDATGKQLGVKDPFDPRQNVEGGVTYLRQMLDRYGDLSLALAAYNAGPQAVDRFGGIPPYAETQLYVSLVHRVHTRFCDHLA